ncbi:MAG: nucleotidyltransferase [Candidatus Omnitrophota bacterium]|jgi:nucleotidyltransferase substrate binding protein (TIGR01987 family)|nr:MAG: nucleotidyltransferase [Candidatus Omnitrophota bacterium]
MSDELRWKQRFRNFEKAFFAFQRRMDDYEKDPESESHQMALVQGYEIIIELAWKVMKDYLQNEGYDINTGKQAIRQAYQIEMIREGEIWLQALDNRNLASHTYDENLLNTLISFITEQFYPLVRDFYFDLQKES